MPDNAILKRTGWVSHSVEDMDKPANNLISSVLPSEELTKPLGEPLPV